jgi:hypothetical protein
MFGNASTSEMQLALQREAQSRKVFFPVGGILSYETLVARVA